MPTTVLIVIQILLLIFGWSIFVITGYKLQYYSLILVSLAVYILNIKKPIIRPIFLYCLIVLFYFVVSQFYFETTIANTIPLSYYLIIPFVFGRNIIDIKDYNNIFSMVSFVSIVLLFGVILQIIGLESEVLATEKTITRDIVHNRFTSFIGSSLLFGLISAIMSLSSYYYYKKSKNIVFLITFICALVCVILSYSRGSYVVAAIGVAMIYFLGWEKSRNTYLTISMFFIFSATALLMINHLGQNVALDRLVSSLNFVSDPGNIERLIRWERAVSQIDEKLFTGSGLGSTGSVGSERFSETVYTTESYYLKVFLEGGIFLGLAYTILTVYICMMLFNKARKNNLYTLGAAIFISLTIESLFLQSLESPLLALIYWLSAGTLTENI